jgi:hypothetical protein
MNPQNTQPFVRPATLKDVPDIMHIYEESYNARIAKKGTQGQKIPLTPKQYKRKQERIVADFIQNGCDFLLLEDKGFMGYTIEDDKAYIKHFYTIPSDDKPGSAILNYFQTNLPESVKEILVSAGDRNKNVYAHLGYENIVPGFKIMRKELKPNSL